VGRLILVLLFTYPVGGDVDITDEDGDTPLYAVENVETARFLVEHGATVNRVNNDGISVRTAISRSQLRPDLARGFLQPVEHLSTDFPEVSNYLQSLLQPGTAPSPDSSATSAQQPSQYHQEIASEQLTTTLMQSAQEIMQRAEVGGRDPEEDLRQVVGRTVLEGMIAGYGIGIESRDEDRHEEDDRRNTDGLNGAKRRKPDKGEDEDSRA
jgi:hypothetical protein